MERGHAPEDLKAAQGELWRLAVGSLHGHLPNVYSWQGR